MKVLSVETARVGLLKTLAEILPLDGVYPPDLTAAVAERYSFVYPPDFSQPWSSFQEKGIEFTMGRLDIGGGRHPIEKLLVARDGLFVTASNTRFGEAVLTDLLAWDSETYGFRIPDKANSLYAFVSQLVVEFNVSLDPAISAFATLSEACADSFKQTYGVDVILGTHGFSLNYDRSAMAGGLSLLAGFGIERRIGEPYHTSKFFCQAPLRTDDHVKLLELIESTVAGLS